MSIRTPYVLLLLAGLAASWTSLAAPSPADAAPAWQWPALTAEQQGDLVEQMDSHVLDLGEKADVKLRAMASEHFLFYTDSPSKRVDRRASLEAAYAKLCGFLGMDPRQNHFKGKCAVILAKNAASHDALLAYISPGDNSENAAGLTASDTPYPGGCLINLAFVDGDDTGLTMRHELAHAMLHVFHGHADVPSWVTEGFAEYTSTDGKGEADQIAQSRADAAEKGDLRDFFYTDRIVAEHYGVAFEVTRMLAEKDRKGYLAFLAALKEGMDQEEALRIHCKTSFRQLAAEYAKSIGVPSLKLHLEETVKASD